MIPVIVISDNPNHPGQLKLTESLHRHGWIYTEITTPFRGLGMKISELARYLRYSENDEFILLDAFDTYAVAGPADWNMITNRVIVSGEKHCYPNPGLSDYFIHKSPWRYVNSGQVFGNKRYFLDLVERYPFPDEDNDQIWYTEQAMHGRVDIDYHCQVFQSIAFESEGDFTLADGRLTNNLTGSSPIFLHGNGRTPLDIFYTL